MCRGQLEHMKNFTQDLGQEEMAVRVGWVTVIPECGTTFLVKSDNRIVGVSQWLLQL